MRKALAILALFLTGLATIAFAINSHMMEDERRHVGYFYLSLGIALTLASAVLGAIYLWYEPTPKKVIEWGEGVNYSPALRKALARLKSFSDHLPTEDLPEHDVNEYHSILDVIGTEIHQDLSAFHIPPAKLIRHWAGTTWEGAYSGFRNLESAERFCKPADFRIALSGAMTFIDSCLQEIPLKPHRVDSKELGSKANATETQPRQLQTSANSQTSDDYKPDNIAIEILKQIKWGVVWESELANVLKLDPKQIRKSLLSLEHNQYICLQRPVGRAPFYMLADKGGDFLNKPVQAAPPPDSYPDSLSTEILKSLADPDLYKDAESIAKSLNLHPEKVRLFLSRLEHHGYVHEQQFIGDLSEYSLTDKGRYFLNDLGFFG